jgi:hypothetical protein
VILGPPPCGEALRLCLQLHNPGVADTQCSKFMSRPTRIKLPPVVTPQANSGKRRRSGSIVKVEEVGDRSVEEVLDRSAFVNINADWVNAKGMSSVPWTHPPFIDSGAGAWLIHIVLICAGKIIIDNIPGMTQQISWTLVNLLYLAVRPGVHVVCHTTPHIASLNDQLTYLMFHWVTGIPFENDLHGGAYDDLTLWEQIDDGAQYTPAKKWLLSVPIFL